ncbi:FprA family A-type flavoprotein [Coprothermobacteraceae bacterium]|nr:FprA family A-type flavoprotein [Coprothermobacteraceae bacterium]
MKPRKITDDVYFVGAPDWDRRYFDSLIPLPQGTSYNAYLIKGEHKTALIDTVDPSKWEMLDAYLSSVNSLDYVIVQHVEQDHSGSLPMVLQKYPEATVITNAKAKELLLSHLHVPEDRITVIKDGDSVDLGGLRLLFILTPWVHWPETMVTYLPERQVLFTCDFFGSHLATSDLFVLEEKLVYQGAKRYYAEIMSPFRGLIRTHLGKVRKLDLRLIAPSHGPVYSNPEFILSAYEEWSSEMPKNVVLIPWVSMHGSTQAMVDFLTYELVELGLNVDRFDVSTADLGELTMATVDAATIILASPTTLTGPHPAAEMAAYWIGALRPKARSFGIIGSYGWGTRMVDVIKGLWSSVNAEFLEPILVKGYPTEADFNKLAELARTIAQKHMEMGLM